MKNLWKILAALLVVALPMLVASCGDDDEVEGPVTYTYKWELQNASLGNSATTAERMAALNAEESVNSLLANAFKAKGFVVTPAEQKFTIETEEDVDRYDNQVKSALYAVLAEPSLATVVEPLPNTAKVVVKRGSKTVIENKLK